MKTIIFTIFLSTLLKASSDNSFRANCTFIGIKCYALSNVTKTQSEASNICFFAGGSLAIVEEDYVWRQIITQLLKGETNNLWLGLTVSRESYSFDQRVDLSRNSFWSSNRLSYDSYNRQCMYSQQGNWQYYLTSFCTNYYKFLCQFEGCKKSDIIIENADYEDCNSSELFPNQKTLEIKCRDNYLLLGSNTTTCRNSNWTEIPNCVPVCRSPAVRSNAQLSDGTTKNYFELDEEAVFLCKRGFYAWDKSELISHFKIRCEEGGVWSNPDKDCIQSVTIKIRNQPSISLNCSIRNSTPVKWLKNDELLVSNSSKHKMLSSGVLKLTHPNESDTGFYFCIGKKNNETNIQNVFKLIKYEKCKTSIHRSLNTTHEVNENDDLLLSCNLRSGEFSWQTDSDEILQSNDKNIILPSGSLFLKNIKLDDGKVYSCNCENLTTATHVVHVTASTETICGTNATSSVVTLWHSDDLTPFCYGTLIDTQWVITSAFCLESYRRMKNPNITIHLTGSDANGRKRVKASTINIHPLYRSRINVNDIALLKLEEQLKFSLSLRPTCLKEIDFSPKYQCQESIKYITSVIGWGSLDFFKYDNKIPGEEEMNLIRSEECRKNATVISTEDLFCGQSNEILYFGDTGAPFVANLDGKAFIIGIYNWGQRATRLGSFDYFTDVLYHYQWIKQIIL